MNNYPASSRQHRAVELILDAWAERAGLRELAASPTERQAAFVDRLDLAFEARRLVFTRYGLNDLYGRARRGSPDAPRRSQIDLAKQHMNDGRGQLDPLLWARRLGRDFADEVGALFGNEAIRDVTDRESAWRSWATMSERIDAVVESLATALEIPLRDVPASAWRDLSAATTTWSREMQRHVFVRFLGFPWWDVLLYPTQALTGVDEINQPTPTRLSPDRVNLLARGNPLYGSARHHFGRVLQLMWARARLSVVRLDGAEHLVSMLLGHDHPDRRAWCERLFLSILDEERASLPKVGDVIDRLRASVLEGTLTACSVQGFRREDPRRGARGVRPAARRPGGRARRAAAPARCSCGSSPAASATPTSTRPRAPIRPATRRRCSATRARASSRRSARTSARSRPATTSSRSSRRSAASASTAAASARTSASRSASSRTRATCPTARRASSPRRRADPPLHGHLDVRRVHGHAGDRAREGQPRGAARRRVPLRLRPLDRARRGDEHGARSRPGRPASSSAPAWSGSAPSPAAGCRAPSGSSASTSRRSGSSSRARQGATDTLAGGPDVVDEILEHDRRLRRRLHLRGDRATWTSCAQAVEAARMGWGLCTIAGVAGKGETLDIVPRFLITGRRVAGSSFGGVKGRDQVPAARRALAGGRDRRRPVHLAPDHARRRQPRLRADGGAGRHPQRDRVRMIVERVEHPEWLSNAYLVAEGAGRPRLLHRRERPDRRARAPRRDGRDHDHARPLHARPRRPRRRHRGARGADGVPLLAHAATRRRAPTSASRDGDTIESGELERARALHAGPLPRPSRVPRRRDALLHRGRALQGHRRRHGRAGRRPRRAQALDPRRAARARSRDARLPGPPRADDDRRRAALEPVHPRVARRRRPRRGAVPRQRRATRRSCSGPTTTTAATRRSCDSPPARRRSSAARASSGSSRQSAAC